MNAVTCLGPALTAFGVGGALADPRLKLFASGNTVEIAANDNWDAAAGERVFAGGRL